MVQLVIDGEEPPVQYIPPPLVALFSIQIISVSVGDDKLSQDIVPHLASLRINMRLTSLGDEL
jgi:hypothetical protein